MNNRKNIKYTSILIAFLLSIFITNNTAKTAVCPTLQSGNLFKVENNSAVYIIDANLNRLYFPNSEIFYTWFDDFSEVIEIPNTCVDNYPIPDTTPYGINYRPGSRLIKVKISPSVYVIEPNNTIRKITSEQIARDLYGDNWNSLVRDVSDAFWPNYKNKKADIIESKPHEGMIVKQKDRSDIYYVKDNGLKLINNPPDKDIRILDKNIFNTQIILNGTVEKDSLYENPPQKDTTILTSSGQISLTPPSNNETQIETQTDSTHNPLPAISSTITPEGLTNWVNYYRIKKGLPALTTNKTLTEMAQFKINDLYEKQYTGHTRADGTGGPGDLAEWHNYKYLVIGENIIFVDIPNYTDKQYVDAWLSSPGHAANIYRTSYTESGMAVGKVWYGSSIALNAVQEFGAPRSLCPYIDESLTAEVKNMESNLKILLDEINSLNDYSNQDELNSYNQKIKEYNTLLDNYNILADQYTIQANNFNTCLQNYKQ